MMIAFDTNSAFLSFLYYPPQILQHRQIALQGTARYGAVGELIRIEPGEDREWLLSVEKAISFASTGL